MVKAQFYCDLHPTYAKSFDNTTRYWERPWNAGQKICAIIITTAGLLVSWSGLWSPSRREERLEFGSDVRLGGMSGTQDDGCTLCRTWDSPHQNVHMMRRGEHAFRGYWDSAKVVQLSFVNHLEVITLQPPKPQYFNYPFTGTSLNYLYH